tara:strand:- start:164 stop:322 length:159 start_codon:yes stop_codon:yes gene_type:complete
MRFLIALIFPFLTIFNGQVISGYQFGEEQKIKGVRKQKTPNAIQEWFAPLSL